jgi:hypothetical protein
VGSLRVAGTVLVLLGLWSLLSLAPSSPGTTRDLVIRNARIIDGTGRVIEGGTIVVTEGRISSVAEEVPGAQGTREIDARGMTAMPGLIDSHRDPVLAAIADEARSLGLAAMVHAHRVEDLLAAARLGASHLVEIGTLEPGKAADIVLLDGDPLADISDLACVRVVIQGGRVVMDDRQAEASRCGTPIERRAPAAGALDAGAGLATPGSTGGGAGRGRTEQDQILLGRLAVTTRGCPDCHGGVHPAGEGYLAGLGRPEDAFPVGEYRVWARNLTPDNLTGLGRFTERQIFNSLRYGLRPSETPDVEITSTTPGEGNFPEHPKYLAPPMPWPYFRHMPDEELWAIAAYLKRAVRPVSNRIPDSEGPPDFWAGEYTVEAFGPFPLAPFPTANERPPD